MNTEPEIATCEHIFCSQCGEKFERVGCQATPACQESHLKGEELLLSVALLTRLSSTHQGEVQDGTWGDSHMRSSPKFDALLKLLAQVPTYMNEDNVAVREKTLVFSQWTSALDLLEPHIRRAGYRFNRIDGTMDQSRRTAALAEFKAEDDISIILLSLHAASTGLNMAFANHVVLLDNWWNPTVEDQAVDRAHRLGQQKEVFVTSLIHEDTVEQSVVLLQENKRQMIDTVVYYVGKGKQGKQKDLEFLFQNMQGIGLG